MSEPLEYDCQDCGVHVFSFGLREIPSPPRCQTCITIRELPRGERDEMRAHLYDLDAMTYWIKAGCYCDETFPERPCDYCATPYRGPSVYCCLDCAQADL